MTMRDGVIHGLGGSGLIPRWEALSEGWNRGIASEWYRIHALYALAARIRRAFEVCR